MGRLLCNPIVVAMEPILNASIKSKFGNTRCRSSESKREEVKLPVVFTGRA
jgi:hypothetical protein